MLKVCYGRQPAGDACELELAVLEVGLSISGSKTVQVRQIDHSYRLIIIYIMQSIRASLIQAVKDTVDIAG